jgi:hypothetical protein
MKKIITTIAFVLFAFSLSAQGDLLDELDSQLEEDSTEVTSVFKGLKVVNIESTKLAAKGDFYFIIAHRFGYVNGGFKELFGLDESNIRFSFIYGFTDWLSAGLSRSSLNKTYDVNAKIKLLSQKKDDFPLNIVGFTSMAAKTGETSLNKINYPLLEYKHRFNYLAELLISSKINKNLSLQVSPMFIHENLTLNNQSNDQFAAGIGGRYKLSKRLTLNIDYVNILNRSVDNTFKNPLSIGFDIETGGHVFQLHFSNSKQMNDSGFLNAEGDWTKGEFVFGFNLSRVF